MNNIMTLAINDTIQYIFAKMNRFTLHVMRSWIPSTIIIDATKMCRKSQKLKNNYDKTLQDILDKKGKVCEIFIVFVAKILSFMAP